MEETILKKVADYMESKPYMVCQHDIDRELANLNHTQQAISVLVRKKKLVEVAGMDACQASKRLHRHYAWNPKRRLKDILGQAKKNRAIKKPSQIQPELRFCFHCGTDLRSLRGR